MRTETEWNIDHTEFRCLVCSGEDLVCSGEELVDATLPCGRCSARRRSCGLLSSVIPNTRNTSPATHVKDAVAFAPRPFVKPDVDA